MSPFLLSPLWLNYVQVFMFVAWIGCWVHLTIRFKRVLMVDYKELRRNMVDCQLRPNDITDLRILEAMDTVPREAFVPEALKPVVYADKEVELVGRLESRGPRSMLTPITLATLVQMADIQKDDFVLDIGCLSGYSSAVLASLADSVIAVETVPDMAKQAGSILSDLQIVNVAVVEGGLAQGQAAQGPYDAILINGAVEAVPEELLSQLKDGGRLVTVMMENGFGRAVCFVRTGGVVGSSSQTDLPAPLLSEFVAVQEFVL